MKEEADGLLFSDAIQVKMIRRQPGFDVLGIPFAEEDGLAMYEIASFGCEQHRNIAQRRLTEEHIFPRSIGNFPE
jgi:hypothetical protein